MVDGSAVGFGSLRIQRDIRGDVVHQIPVEAEAGAAHGLELQLARAREEGVADLFGTKAARRKPPEQSRVRVGTRGGGVEVRGLKIRLREDDLAM